MPVLPLTAFESLLDFVGALPQPQHSVKESSSWEKRQVSVGSGSITAVSSTGQTSPNQYPTLSLSTATPGTAITTSMPTTSSGLETDTTRDTSNVKEGLDESDIKAITFGVIGGVLGLSVLSIIIYRLLCRHKEKAPAKHAHDAFWEKWRWGTYSPVHGDVVYANHGLPTGTILPGAQGNQGKGWSDSWWQKMSVSGMLGSREKKESTKKRDRAKTLYKVKRLKRGGTFEIDSTTDLTSTNSR